MRNLRNKNFLMGLGCGFILSFLLMAVSGPKPEQNTVAEVPKEPIKQEVKVNDTAYQPSQPAANTESSLAKESEPALANKTEPSLIKEAAKEVKLEIPQGATSSKIAHLLADKGIIQDPEGFLGVVSDLKLANKFHSGSYRLKTGEDINVILSVLTKKEISKLKQ